MGLHRQEYWRGLSFSPPGALPDPGTESMSPLFPALAGGFFTTEPPGKSECYLLITSFKIRPLIIIAKWSKYISIPNQDYY